MEIKRGTCPLGNKCEEAKTVGAEQALYRCPWYIQVRGTDMNTGNSVDRFDCAISWMPMLLIENSGMQRQTGAAVESFRNEMVNANNAARLMALGGNQLLLGGKNEADNNPR